MVFKDFPQTSQIWKSETSPNQGTWLGIPWLGLVSLCQVWDFYGYSFNTLKYPKMGIRYFFLWKSRKYCPRRSTTRFRHGLDFWMGHGSGPWIKQAEVSFCFVPFT